MWRTIRESKFGGLRYNDGKSKKEDSFYVGNVRGERNGNLQGIGRLVEGMDIHEAISRIEGIKCGYKATSCPDQLSLALKEYLSNNQ